MVRPRGAGYSPRVAAKQVAKRVLLSLLAGAGAGTILAVLIAPAFISWWASPAMPTVCSCTEQIGWALDRFRTSLGIFAAVAAGASVVLVEVVRALRAKKQQEGQPA